MTGRTATPADADAIAALLAECAGAYGYLPPDADEIRSWFGQPELAAEDFRVFEEEGGLAAYADLRLGEGRDAAWLDARVLSGGPLEAVLVWAEARAREKEARRLRVGVPASGEAGPLRARGYTAIRSFFEMAIRLDGDPPAPAWPDGIHVRTARPGDEERVYAANQEAFADHWEWEPRSFESWTASWDARGRDPALWFLAVAGDEIAGVCLCTTRGDAGWVGDLSVRRPWRRLGLGAALLQQAFHEFRSRRVDRVGLDVDGENTTGAVRLYERVGMHVAHRQDLWQLDLG
ncbi:MAG TPA: GNAT family N-acetyltransferase [Gaiellaceae bacterium]|nr:GNAT family N-acetyltransferase [Gaiellaceae bacterium]